MRSRFPLFATAGLLLALAAASYFVGATYGAGAPVPPPVRSDEIAEKDRKHLSIVDGIPVLELRGTARERGRIHGRVLRRQIRFLVKEYYEAFALKLAGVEGIRAWTDKVLPHIPKHHLEEIKGIAEGAGIPERTMIEVNCVVDRLQMVMCSTVVAAGEATKDGGIYFGRNLDFPGRNILHRMSVVLVFHEEGRIPVAAVTWPGLVGVLSGMNEHGVCGATMMIHFGTPAKPGVPYMMMYREALEKAKKTADVAAHFEATKRTIANNFTVVDATGASEVLEYDASRVVRRPSDKGCVCSTNYFRSEEMRAIGTPLGTGRYRTLAQFLETEHGKIDMAGVRRALRDTATPFYLNVQSMIFLPRERELHLSVGGKLPAAAQRFGKLDRTALFGR
ncbi:MAG: C45 family autoproteolytic acyltransferase/hydrolase [Planctomycetota bacterium]|jgi:predicted choloylglycine hydrolase